MQWDITAQQTKMKTIDTLTMEELENKIYEFGKTIREARTYPMPTRINEEGQPEVYYSKEGKEHIVFNYSDDDELPYYSFCEFLREMGQIFGFEVEKIEFYEKGHMYIFTTLSSKRYHDLLRKYKEKYNEESEDEESDI